MKSAHEIFFLTLTDDGEHCFSRLPHLGSLPSQIPSRFSRPPPTASSSPMGSTYPGPKPPDPPPAPASGSTTWLSPLDRSPAVAGSRSATTTSSCGTIEACCTCPCRLSPLYPKETKQQSQEVPSIQKLEKSLRNG
ncbi:hypothetical protein I3760_02G016200 [Carya illinoinensis]|nr:hypothetical protein I3760_02G016200 [Carya illinoinensis]